MRLVKSSLIFISAVCAIALLLATTVAEQTQRYSKKHSTEALYNPYSEHMKPIDMISPDDTIIKYSPTGYWTCSRHPQIRESESAICPICGKKLVFRRSDSNRTRMTSADDGRMK